MKRTIFRTAFSLPIMLCLVSGSLMAQTPLLPTNLNNQNDIRLLDTDDQRRDAMNEGDGPEGSVFTPGEYKTQEIINPAQKTPMRLVPRPVTQKQPVQQITQTNTPATNQPTNVQAQPLTPASVTQTPNTIQVNSFQANSFQNGILSQNLEFLGADAVGTMRRDEGGFGIDMWNTASRKTIGSLIKRQPTRTPSPVMQALMKRLLLSTAVVPGKDTSAADDNILSARIEALIQAGMLREARDLLEAIPAHEREQDIYTRKKTDVFLLEGNYANACQIAQSQLQATGAPEWMKISGLCHILNENMMGAEIVLNLVREQDPDDQAYLALMDGMVLSSPIELDTLLLPSPLQIAMMRISKTAYPADATIDANNTTKAIIAGSSETDQKIRLNAAFSALASGSIEAKTVAQLMTKVEASTLNPETSTDGELYGAALKDILREQDLQERGRLVQQMIDRSRAEGLFSQVGRLLLPVVEVYDPVPGLLWFAPSAARVLAYNGKYDEVRAWYELARAEETAGNPSGFAASVAIWPLMVLMPAPADEATPGDDIVPQTPVAEAPVYDESINSAAPLEQEMASLAATSEPTVEERKLFVQNEELAKSDPFALTGFAATAMDNLEQKKSYPLPWFYTQDWQTSLSQFPEAQQARVQGTIIPLFEALGYAVKTEALDHMASLDDTSGSLSPPASVWRSFLSATDQNRIGEAVALSLIAFGDDGTMRPTGIFGPSIVNGLKRLGLEDEARALALEIALGAGA